MGTRLTLRAPGDYWLPRDVCSYGYFLLAPNRWDVRTRTMTRPLNLPGGVATARLGQEKRGAGVIAEFDRALARGERPDAERMLTRMLRLDDTGVGEFHRVDPRWASRRRAGGPTPEHAHSRGRGRLFRSPTFFEDLIKTVTSCNVAWPSTVMMNRRLCEVFNPAFPTPAELAAARPATLRARCRVGYRDRRIVELARLMATGAIDVPALENHATPDDTVFQRLLDLPGLGPYSAANIMQLLGRYSRLALDTESVRHGRTVLGFEGADAAVLRRLKAHYEPFGEHRFRSYWFEVWEWYESRRGPSWTWEPAVVGASFTASKFREEDAAACRDTPPGVARRRPAPRASPRVRA